MKRPARKRLLRASVVALVLVSACGPRPSTDHGDEAAGEASDPANSAPDELVEFWQTYRAATAARAAGDQAAAVSGYRRALAYDPDHGDSLHFLAQLLYAHGDVDGARQLLLRLTRTEDRSLRGWQQLSVVQGNPAAGWRPDPRAAQDAIATALGWNPSNSGAHALMARWLAYSGDFDRAHASIAVALGHNPINIEARLLDLWLAGRTGDPAAATRAAGDAVAALCKGPGDCVAPGRLALAVARLRASLPGFELDREIAARLPALAPANRPGDHPGPYREESAAAAGMRTLLGLEGRETLPAWSQQQEAGAAPFPWRAARIVGQEQDARTDADLLLLGGGSHPVRRLRRTGTSWQAVPTPGLPEDLLGAAMAVADFDGDGLPDVVLANVPRIRAPGDAPAAPAAATVARLYHATPEGGFEGRDLPIAGIVTAVLAFDVDRDGDPDLIVARLPATPEQSAASYLEADAPPVPSVVVLYNDGTVWTADAAALPTFGGTVLDLAAVPRGDGFDLYLATGTLLPEVTEPDQLWRHRGSSFVDASADLGDGRFASTLRVRWEAGRYELALLRGGLVDGDPARTERLRLPR